MVGRCGSSFSVPKRAEQEGPKVYILPLLSSSHPLTQIKQTVKRGSLIFDLPTNGEPYLINLRLFSVAWTTYMRNDSFLISRMFFLGLAS